MSDKKEGAFGSRGCPRTPSPLRQRSSLSRGETPPNRFNVKDSVSELKRKNSVRYTKESALQRTLEGCPLCSSGVDEGPTVMTHSSDAGRARISLLLQINSVGWAIMGGEISSKRRRDSPRDDVRAVRFASRKNQAATVSEG